MVNGFYFPNDEKNNDTEISELIPHKNEPLIFTNSQDHQLWIMKQEKEKEKEKFARLSINNPNKLEYYFGKKKHHKMENTDDMGHPPDVYSFSANELWKHGMFILNIYK